LIAELVRTLHVRQASLTQPHLLRGHNRGHIFLVADGMGGHPGGDVASALSLTSIEAFVLHILHRFSNLEVTDEQTVIRDLQAALRQADARIFDEAAHHPEFTGMGTTLTMAFASGWKLFVIHAGDSRCYLCRGGKLRQLTNDHTLAEELVRHGLIKSGDVSHHPYRHVLTNFLGRGQAGLQVEVHQTDLQAGDVMLLCSDGLTDMLSDDEITKILAAESEPQRACECLVAGANARGGRDDMTAIVACFEAN